jgi:hypothetical protein
MIALPSLIYLDPIGFANRQQRYRLEIAAAKNVFSDSGLFTVR